MKIIWEYVRGPYLDNERTRIVRDVKAYRHSPFIEFDPSNNSLILADVSGQQETVDEINAKSFAYTRRFYPHWLRSVFKFIFRTDGKGFIAIPNNTPCQHGVNFYSSGDWSTGAWSYFANSDYVLDLTIDEVNNEVLFVGPPFTCSHKVGLHRLDATTGKRLGPPQYGIEEGAESWKLAMANDVLFCAENVFDPISLTYSVTVAKLRRSQDQWSVVDRYYPMGMQGKSCNSIKAYCNRLFVCNGSSMSIVDQDTGYTLSVITHPEFTFRAWCINPLTSELVVNHGADVFTVFDIVP